MIHLLRLVVVCSIAATPSFGALEFKQTPFELPTIQAGMEMDFDLLSSLQKTGTGTLRWSVGSLPLPGWLRLDATRGHLVGTPRFQDAGEFHFRLSVEDTTDDGVANQEFVVRVSAPPLWKANVLDLGIQNEGLDWTFDLKSGISNPAGGDMTFSGQNFPEWMTLDTKTGILSGTPQTKNVGPYSNVRIRAMGRGGMADTLGHGLVVRFSKPPQWSKTEISLPAAVEGNPYQQDLAALVLNPQNLPLKFEWLGASWLRVGSTSAQIYGTPTRENIAEKTGTVVLHGTLDGVAFESRMQVNVGITSVNHAPEWVVKALTLPPAMTTSVYQQDLSHSANDADGDALQFRILSGPDWLKIDAKTGVISGTIPKTAIGPNRWSIAVADPSGLSDTLTLDLMVAKVNEAPVWSPNPLSLPPIQQGKAFTFDLTTMVTDPDGDAIHFAKVSAPSWVTITPTGTISGIPGRTDVGTTRMRIRAFDSVAGSATVEAILFVEPVNQAPRWVLNPIYLGTREDQLYSVDLSAYAKDEDPGDSLYFGILEGPKWAELTPQGILKGMPARANAGENKIRVRIRDKQGLKADAVVIVQVNTVNRPPTIKSNPLELAKVNVGDLYRADISALASDSDAGDKITFEKASTTPKWIEVSPNGLVTGTPTAQDVGLNRFDLRVVDGQQETAQAEVQIWVVQENRAPRWRQAPVILPPAAHSVAYDFDLGPLAIDDDGDRLRFLKKSGPDWMVVSETGKVSGTPPLEQVGSFKAEFHVTDGKIETAANVEGTVIKQNRAPKIEPIPVFVVRERNQLSVELGVPTYVSDPDGDKLRFKLTSASDWVSLSESGTLIVQPKTGNVGVQSFGFSVDDGQLSATSKIQISVLRDAKPPFWIEDPIEALGRADEPFMMNLTDKARERDLQKLTFLKKDGPAWLEVSTEGLASGQPPAAGEGLHVFVVSACNEKFCTDAKLKITLSAKVETETFALNSKERETPIDVLWMLDHSKSSENTIRDLKREVGGLFTQLDQKSVRHSSILLSSDVNRWKGEPVAEPSAPLTVSYSAPERLAQFNLRTDMTLSVDECPNCFSSPTFALHQFFTTMQKSDVPAQTQFVRAAAPMDVVIVTHQRDHYPKYIGANDPASPTALWQSFAQAAAERGTSLRIHALTPTCPELFELSGDAASAGPPETYRLLVSKSFGRLLAPNCEFDMKRSMETLTTALTSRARSHAYREVTLKKQPNRSPEIRVELDGRALRSPVQNQDPQWKYNPDTNTVQILWNRIDFGQLSGDETIKVQYPTDK